MNNRIENLLSRVVILEERLDSRPSDVADQRHRDELIRYVAIPPLLLALMLFWQAWYHRATTAILF